MLQQTYATSMVMLLRRTLSHEHEASPLDLVPSNHSEKVSGFDHLGRLQP